MNQMFADKVTKRDLVINFRKPRLGEVAPALVITGDEDATTFAEKARAILIDALERHPGSTGDRLYDELVSRMVRRGEFERHNFEALLAQVAEPVHEPVMRNLFEAKSPDLFGSHEAVRWYLKDTADRADEAESAREAAAAARLEVFMRAALTPGPSPKPGRGETMAEGTHYSDLFEQYLGVKDKPAVSWLTGCRSSSSRHRTVPGVRRRMTLNNPCSLRSAQAARSAASSASPMRCWTACNPSSETGPLTSPPPPTGSGSAAAPGCTSWGAPFMRRARSRSPSWARSARKK